MQNVAQISLSGGGQMLVDISDVELVAGLTWVRTRPSKCRTEYACAWGGQKSVYAHRLIMAAPAGMQIDHINGNGLDNRRDNLRLATQGQNNANRPATNKTGFRGVYRDRRRFVASISNPARKPHNLVLGRFGDAESAARAYDAAAVQLFGQFARLNFPEAR